MLQRSKPLLLIALLLVGATATLVHPRQAGAAQITDRSLTLQSGTDPIVNGGSKVGAAGVHHLFTFTLPTAGNVGSIQFKYCTLPNGPSVACNTPAGLSTTSSTLGTDSGVAGFTLNNSTNGAPYVTRTATSIGANTQAVIGLDNITNPNATDPTCAAGVGGLAPSCTFFVWITSYSDADLGGTVVDTGTVTASVTEQITLTGTMPESLVFCTGGTVTTTAGVPDCATATDGAISFDKLFSPTDTALATSQMVASTNAGSGYSVTVNGPTLTSGSNTVTAMNTIDTSKHGVSQFGMNLVLNDGTAYAAAPNITSSADVSPTSNGTNYRGEPVAGYNADGSHSGRFKFADGNTVADSSQGGAGGTDAQIFTVSYIVNVPGSQPAGTYTTTLTYICTADF